MPGQLDESIARATAGKGDKISINPTELKADEADKVNIAISSLFGTPAQPLAAIADFQESGAVAAYWR
ncbi:hypothetical protein B4Q13_23195, partial [Lacticaseibacillus rhamnosus]